MLRCGRVEEAEEREVETEVEEMLRTGLRLGRGRERAVVFEPPRSELFQVLDLSGVEDTIEIKNN